METKNIARKGRFEFLDGIRGLAAIFVLIRHTGGLWNVEFFHSYLAVDIFFMLSGFVIAHAYDERINNGTISIFNFVQVRVIRLYPVYIFSLLLISIFLFGQMIVGKHFNSFELMQFASMVALTAIFLPSHVRGDNALFPINGPYWSLFFELIANFVYAVICPKLTKLLNVLIVLCAGVAMAIIAFRNGDLNIGFSWGLKSIVGGLSRSHFGFFLGLLLYKYHVAFACWCKGRVSHWFSIAAVVAILACPSFGTFNPWFDLLAIALVFPMCVLIAAQPVESESKLTGTLVLLGAASYPLYVLHIPMAKVLNQGLKYFPIPLGGFVFAAIVIAFSIWLERKYDIPLRRKMMARLGRRKITMG
ncbi:acyltransferase family protein [Rugamonas sp. DEMB1]|uniref:acyltransferase family protein n=1 Tax=Rugamonas sp. DEMB1 TaxID=3039386 RepID=UPI002448B8CF|nr:acyltransferase [Rugamonas sp. DEMB1]WGG49809.1 acyltransferase [Rugamonas sp. DEMB1]